MAGWFQAKLNSVHCRNQGYVLDGYPKVCSSCMAHNGAPTHIVPQTDVDAKIMFASTESEDLDKEILPGDSVMLIQYLLLTVA